MAYFCMLFKVDDGPEIQKPPNKLCPGCAPIAITTAVKDIAGSALSSQITALKIKKTFRFIVVFKHNNLK